MAQKDKFAIIDGTLDIEEQQDLMRRHVTKLLPPPKTTPPIPTSQSKEAGVA